MQALRVGGAVFLISFFSLMLLWDITLRVLSVISYPLARRYEDRVEPGYAARLFSLARCYTGMRIQRRCRLPASLPPAFMIISNHQSFIDIAYLIYAFAGYRLRFVAKDSLAHWIPYVSPLFRLQRHALVSRAGNVRKTKHELIRLATIAPDGYCPVVFPEGTRSKTGELGKFHSGAVRAVLSKTPLPVLCVALDGGHMVASLDHLFTKMKKASYKISPLTLFPAPRGKDEISFVISESRRLIDEQLKRWRTDAGN